MMGHKVHFKGEILKIIQKLSLFPFLFEELLFGRVFWQCLSYYSVGPRLIKCNVPGAFNKTDMVFLIFELNK